MNTYKRYAYRQWFSSLYLCLPYLLALSLFAGYVWFALLFFRDISPIIAILLSAVLALGVLYDILRFRVKSYPVAIEIADGRVSLFRFRKYCEFSLQDVKKVTKPSWYSGWAEVRLVKGTFVTRFAVATYMPELDELLQVLLEGQNSGAGGPRGDGSA